MIQFQQEWECLKSEYKDEEARSSIWTIQQTEPLVRAQYVLFALLQKRPDAVTAWNTMAEKFKTLLIARIQEKANSKIVSPGVFKHQWDKESRIYVDSFQQAYNAVKTFVDEWLNGSNNASVVIVCVLVQECFPTYAKGLHRKNVLCDWLSDVTDAPVKDLRLVLLSRKRPEQAARKLARQNMGKSHGFHLRKEEALLKVAYAWIDFNVPEVEGQSTPTRDEVAQSYEFNPNNLSRAIELFDAAIDKKRVAGPPPGKRHRSPNIIGEKPVRF